MTSRPTDASSRSEASLTLRSCKASCQRAAFSQAWLHGGGHGRGGHGCLVFHDFCPSQSHLDVSSRSEKQRGDIPICSTVCAHQIAITSTSQESKPRFFKIQVVSKSVEQVTFLRSLCWLEPFNPCTNNKVSVFQPCRSLGLRQMTDV